ncbi:MAG: tRNA pseudouridine(55) synthase TruB [Sphaerochaetaceae bacterium]|nr:tRNA pseudouridine(55) synthase TruB [Sphaerochaetaceae bacterium]
MNSIILANKSEGITSFSCLGKIKHIVDKKSGHCGTLDKFASGLIIVLCGSFTKLVPVFMGLDKKYEATIELGKTTDTLDPEGKVISTKALPSFEKIQEAVSSLVGKINQVPPLYSAIHVDGKRSYDLVRKGEEVTLKSRPIEVYEATIISYEEPYLKVRLHVSKGTYVRSWARDLGELCNSCAYVTQLKRTAIGPFSLEESIVANDEEALRAYNPDLRQFLKRIFTIEDIEIPQQEVVKVKNGFVSNSLKNKICNADLVFYTYKGKDLCIYEVKEGKILCQIKEEC